MSARPIHALASALTERSPLARTEATGRTGEVADGSRRERFERLLGESQRSALQQAGARTAAASTRGADGGLPATATATGERSTLALALRAASAAPGTSATGLSPHATTGARASSAGLPQTDATPQRPSADAAATRDDAAPTNRTPVRRTADNRDTPAARAAQSTSGSDDTPQTDTPQTDAAADGSSDARAPHGHAAEDGRSRPGRTPERARVSQAAHAAQGREPAHGRAAPADATQADGPAAASEDTAAMDESETAELTAPPTLPDGTGVLDQAREMQALIGQALALTPSAPDGASSSADLDPAMAAQAMAGRGSPGTGMADGRLAGVPSGRGRVGLDSAVAGGPGTPQATGQDGTPVPADGERANTDPAARPAPDAPMADPTAGAATVTSRPTIDVAAAPRPDEGASAVPAAGGPGTAKAGAAALSGDAGTPATSATNGHAAAGFAAALQASASGAPLAAGPTSGTSANTATAQATLQASIDSADFAPALGGQIVLWARDGVQQAQLNLNPAELGPVQVRIAIEGDQARVDFQAAHAETREALREAREILAQALQDAGLALSGSEVGAVPDGRATDAGGETTGGRERSSGGDARGMTQGQSQSHSQAQSQAQSQGRQPTTAAREPVAGPVDARLAQANAAAVPADARRSERLLDLQA